MVDTWSEASLVAYIPETDSSEEIIIHTQPFSVKIGSPICTDIRLVLEPTVLNKMETYFGRDDAVMQQLKISDESGILELGYCELQVSVSLEEEPSTFLTLNTIN